MVPDERDGDYSDLLPPRDRRALPPYAYVEYPIIARSSLLRAEMDTDASQPVQGLQDVLHCLGDNAEANQFLARVGLHVSDVSVHSTEMCDLVMQGSWPNTFASLPLPCARNSQHMRCWPTRVAREPFRARHGGGLPAEVQAARPQDCQRMSYYKPGISVDPMHILRWVRVTKDIRDIRKTKVCSEAVIRACWPQKHKDMLQELRDNGYIWRSYSCLVRARPRADIASMILDCIVLLCFLLNNVPLLRTVALHV